MFARLIPIFAMLMPVSGATQPPPPASMPAPFAWLIGTWRTDALEMRCEAAEAALRCHEEGRSAAMKGAEARLAIVSADGAAGTQLKVDLPTIPTSVFTEVARGAQTITYRMPTKLGVARLRFTREGDALKIERGDDAAWMTTMTYRKG